MANYYLPTLRTVEERLAQRMSIAKRGGILDKDFQMGRATLNTGTYSPVSESRLTNGGLASRYLG
jgi:hypothetical protein